MSKVVRTMPTYGERAIITEYGYRTPATFMGECEDRGHLGDHWCYDETNSDGATWVSQPAVAREPMSLTTPAVGERAIITEYGGRIPATYVEKCDGTHAAWATRSHWCFDEPTPRGATWTSHPHVAREPILAPREWQPGDVVDHPEHGRGFVYEATSDRLVVRFLESVWPISHMTDGLTLVLPAPAPPVVKPDEPQRLGSVVRDGEGRWILADPGTTHPWYHAGGYKWRSWGEMPDAVTIERGDDQ